MPCAVRREIFISASVVAIALNLSAALPTFSSVCVPRPPSVPYTVTIPDLCTALAIVFIDDDVSAVDDARPTLRTVSSRDSLVAVATLVSSVHRPNRHSKDRSYHVRA